MSKRKRAQVEDDESFDGQTEFDLTGAEENDLADIVVSDEEEKDVTKPPPAKKRKKNNPYLAKLKVLTKEEILELISTAAEKHPEIIDYLATSAPKPTLDKTKELINKLERDYNKAFPYNRYGSNTDKYAHNRVAGRLAAFKKNLVDKANEIKASGEWELLLEYVVFGAGKATSMPIWDLEDHNKSRKAAIKKFIDLANSTIKKLKKEKSADFWEPYKEKFARIGEGFEVVANSL